MLSRMNFVLVVAFVAVALVGWAWVAPCSAELMQNGSFEQPTTCVDGSYGCDQAVPVGTYSMPGPNKMPGWTVGSSSSSSGNFAFPDWFSKNGGVSAEDGSYFWNPASTGCYLQQTFAVTASATYSVSFYEASRSANYTTNGINVGLTIDGGGTLTGTSGTLTVSGSGTGASPLTGNAFGPQNIWTQYTFSFVPSLSGNVTFRLTGICPTGNTGSFLDNVSVTGVPEPGTLALLAAGLVGLLCYAWRKRR